MKHLIKYFAQIYDITCITRKSNKNSRGLLAFLHNPKGNLVFYSGRAPGRLTLDLLHQQGYSSYKPFPDQTHGHSVTVPGAPAAWVDTVEKYGSGKVRLWFVYLLILYFLMSNKKWYGTPGKYYKDKRIPKFNYDHVLKKF